MAHVAMHWQSGANGSVECALCAHKCKINPGKRGICGVRENRDGKLYSLVYGLSTGGSVDPIEKKPLYHFYPGTNVLSYGTVGCNLKCMHCQNYTTSQSDPESPYLQRVKLEDITDLCKSYGCGGVAWTYNEPTVWYEFTLDGSKAVKKAGLYTVYVTNGYISEAPLREIAPYLDAMNIDVKGFTEDFYRKVSKARLQPVLDTCMLAHSLKIHVELTYLIIPGFNDKEDEMTKFCSWVKDSLAKDVPVHFSRFHPDYKMADVPSTPINTLKLAYNVAKKAGLEFVYIGNVHGLAEDNTFCPSCGAELIKRDGLFSRVVRVKDGACPKCSTKINLRN